MHEIKKMFHSANELMNIEFINNKPKATYFLDFKKINKFR